MKKILIILGLAAAHFALSLAFFGQSFMITMDRFDTARELTTSERIVETISDVLLFPIVPLAQLVPGRLMRGLLGYVPFVINSLLWATVLYFLINLFARRRLYHRLTEAAR